MQKERLNCCEIDKMICSSNSTLKDVISSINNNSKKTVFMVDDNNRLAGIITDGDVRRLLLDGVGLEDSIKDHINSSYVYAYQDEKASDIIKRFNGKITIIPLVDKDFHVVDYMEFDKNLHISLAQPQLDGNEYQYLMDAFLSTWISSAGKYVKLFEETFAKYCDMAYGVSTSNGTTALHLALLALGIKEGDEVIVPDLTFAATVNAVLYTGATPVIVDIEKDYWCISPDEIEKAITPHTKAIIPVHLYGQPCDMERICQIAKDNGLYIIEDCAEAHGAEFDGKKVGSFGDISCFSFYGNKVITTGEGGMCLTNDAELDKKMRLFRDHGMSKDKRYFHEVIGFNYRMTNMQAAIGVAQVEKIDKILTWREELEKKYREQLANNTEVVLQKIDDGRRKKITWLMSVLVAPEKREEIIERFNQNNIDIRKFFYPLHDMEVYKKYVFGSCDVSSEVSKRGLNLPTTVDVTEQMVSIICECL